ncbi:hypothetical protein HanRHA438_Chr04g0173991 [Helianthus annuus]|nr:hypothetical protein HanRHA438_Chr04g0173991 [Helianthus annuus]
MFHSLVQNIVYIYDGGRRRSSNSPEFTVVESGHGVSRDIHNDNPLIRHWHPLIQTFYWHPLLRHWHPLIQTFYWHPLMRHWHPLIHHVSILTHMIFLIIHSLIILLIHLMLTLLAHLLISQLTVTIHLQIQNIKSCGSFDS